MIRTCASLASRMRAKDTKEAMVFVNALKNNEKNLCFSGEPNSRCPKKTEEEMISPKSHLKSLLNSPFEFPFYFELLIEFPIRIPLGIPLFEFPLEFLCEFPCEFPSEFLTKNASDNGVCTNVEKMRRRQWFL